MSNCPSCREPLDYPSGDGCAAMAKHKEKPMSDDLVKKLRETTHMYQVDCELKMKCADRIEELEAKLDWVLVERDETFALMLDRAQTAEDKLAKALTALGDVQRFVKDLAPYADQGHTLVPALERACTTYMELKGETNV